MLVIPESLKKLQLRFTCPELSSSWIEYIFYYHAEDPFQAKAWLQKHMLAQSVVTQLYASHDDAKNEDEKLIFEKLIDELVRLQNIPLDNLENLPESQLIFDLQNFPVCEAVDFVRDVPDALRIEKEGCDEGTLTGEGTVTEGEVNFIIGTTTSEIEDRLLQDYPMQIHQDPQNESHLILSFPKKTSCDMTRITFIEQEKPPEKKIQKKIRTPEWFTILTRTLIPNVGLPEISKMEMLAIDELFRKEKDSQKWIEDFNEITPLLPVEALRATFYNPKSLYGVGYHWVRHLYYVFERDMKTTVARLRWDIVHRLLIHHHYECQSKLCGHALKERQEKINDLVRRRNFSLDQLEEVPKTELKFDLHFFRVEGALEYVDDVIASIESSKTILANASLDITLFTGHGDHSLNNDPAIRRRLLEEYHGKIREDPKIRGALILHFNKKTENLLADAPEWFIDIISVRVTNVHAPHIRPEEIPEIDKILLGKRDHDQWFHDVYNEDKTPLENLQSQFYDGDDYGISFHRIEHIFELTFEDFEVAKAMLKWDIFYRVLIQHLHNTRNQHKALKNEVEVQSYGKRIDAVVRQRNISLDILDIIPLGDLKFDLHWFTANGAIDFVKKLVWEVTASDTILKTAALEIPLLTGHGSHTDRKVSEIQRLLLLNFEGHIRKHDSNPGILILCFEKKRMYSEILSENVI
ncbi:hypothetical protein B9Z55_020967 [Caenorhabditis nigoni]|uniref:Smr domain-containing protein n=1 Tax=Caenorhabditis nigoni TaxID=1611254 RepID=A0A2G5TQT7_9PELO|nr:hypothetical protein B9Z55_020967 [Caenorhabditis nigoni]